MLSSKELRTKIINSKEGVENRFGMETGLIYYRDLSDFCEMGVYRRTGSILDPYFVKSIVPYKQQNEWRMILTGDSNIQLNQLDGYIIKTSPFEFATIFETPEFINGFSVKGI